MFKKNLILYLVFITNTIYAIRHGFTWLYWVTAALTGTLFILDIWEVIVDAKS